MKFRHLIRSVALRVGFFVWTNPVITSRSGRNAAFSQSPRALPNVTHLEKKIRWNNYSRANWTNHWGFSFIWLRRGDFPVIWGRRHSIDWSITVRGFNFQLEKPVGAEVDFTQRLAEPSQRRRPESLLRKIWDRWVKADVKTDSAGKVSYTRAGECFRVQGEEYSLFFSIFLCYTENRPLSWKNSWNGMWRIRFCVRSTHCRLRDTFQSRVQAPRYSRFLMNIPSANSFHRNIICFYT